MNDKLKDICCIKESIISWLKTDVEAVKSGQSNDNYCAEISALTDMVKDLAEAEEKCMKTIYYETVIKAMEEYEDPGESYGERYGYNNRRMSNGQYAKAGMGHRSGYRPMEDFELTEDHYDPGYIMKRYGYHENNMYGREYQTYRDAKRHYTETKSTDDKKKMDEHAMKHVEETVGTIHEIWKDADPILQRRIQNDVNNLVNDMNAPMAK